MHHFVCEIFKFQVYEDDFINADLSKRRECGISPSADGFVAVMLWQFTRLSLCGSSIEITQSSWY